MMLFRAKARDKEKEEELPIINVLIVDDKDNVHALVEKYFNRIGDKYKNEFKINLHTYKVNSIDDFDKLKLMLAKKDYDIYLFDNSLGLSSDRQGYMLATLTHNKYVKEQTRKSIIIFGHTNDQIGEPSYNEMTKAVNMMLWKPSDLMITVINKNSQHFEKVASKVIDQMNIELEPFFTNKIQNQCNSRLSGMS